MPIRFRQPLEDALQRTQSLLLRPFNLGRWFTLGFVAWLIHLGQAGGSAAGSDPGMQLKLRDGDWGGAADSVAEAVHGVLPSGLAVLLIMALAIAVLLVAVTLLWVSCRARFVWLENLTAQDHAIGRHWTRFARQGDSFFLWKLAYYVLLIVILAPLAFFAGLFGVLTGSGFDGPGSILSWMLLGVLTFTVIVILAFVHFYGDAFVTVLMHRRGLTVIPAWRAFRRLFEAHPGAFVAVAFVKFLLHLATAIVVTVFGLITCCVGFLVMAVPYLGAVVQLPIFAALRYYDLCWLGQFADDLRLPAPPISPTEPTPGSDPTP